MTGSGTAGGGRWVLDSSAIMAWFVQEPYTPQTEKILQDAFQNKTKLLVPDLTFVGCANFSGSPQSSVSTRALFDEALEAAVDLGITAYDAVSVVLAQKTGSVLIPRDKRPEIRGKISEGHVEGQKARGNPEKLHPVVHANSPNGKFGAIYSQHRSVPLHLDGILLLSGCFYVPQAFTNGCEGRAKRRSRC